MQEIWQIMQKDSDISYIDNEYGIYIADISDIVGKGVQGEAAAIYSSALSTKPSSLQKLH